MVVQRFSHPHEVLSKSTNWSFEHCSNRMSTASQYQPAMTRLCFGRLSLAPWAAWVPSRRRNMGNYMYKTDTHTHYNILYNIMRAYIYNISTCEIYIHICLSVLYVHDTATSSLRYLDSGALEHDFVCFNWAPLGSCGRSIIDPRMQSQHESTAAKLAT